jgi:outer membrane protein OmpA-like peptidoglycan-associated protein
MHLWLNKPLFIYSSHWSLIMKLRLALAAATALGLPLAAHAQPVTGPYVSLGIGTSISNPTNYGAPTASGKTLTHIDYAGVASVGYGFGNGFRIQLDGNFYRNTFRKNKDETSGIDYGATGGQKTYGPMVNVLYDIPVNFPLIPYVGAGAGYQWVKLNTDLRTGPGSFGEAGGTAGSFAYDVIGGASYYIPGVPGLAVTGEYRFEQLTSHRNYNTIGGTFKAGQLSSHTFLIGLRYQLFNPPPAPMAAPAPAPAPMAAPAPAPARTYLVFFDWDKSDLTSRATDIISQAASDSKTGNVTTLDVSGYTDTSGTADYNQGLSERRAKAVAGQLVTDGVPASEIEIHAYGETHLLVPTGPGVREPQNRRVEIVLQ